MHLLHCTSMIQSHIILVLLWACFSVMHSAFAGQRFKQKMELILKDKYKFYRSIYSLFAVVSLGLVLSFHFSLQSILLWQVSMIEKIISVVMIISGASVMLVFTKRFFFDLSGADVFKKKQISRDLIKTDLYKYVRHPLYSATLVFIWGIFLWKPLLSNVITSICITAYTVIGIYFEEKKLINEFGESYLNYRSKTPMLIPGLNKSID